MATKQLVRTTITEQLVMQQEQFATIEFTNSKALEPIVAIESSLAIKVASFVTMVSSFMVTVIIKQVVIALIRFGFDQTLVASFDQLAFVVVKMMDRLIVPCYWMDQIVPSYFWIFISTVEKSF